MRLAFVWKSLLIFLFPLAISGQAIYDGNVRDVVSQAPIADVQVDLMHSPLNATTNFFGDFLLKNEATDSLSKAPQSFRFYNNSIIWDGDFELDIEMFAIDGRRLFIETDVINNGAYLLPNLPIGVYLIRLRAKGEWHSFKAFSNGRRTHIADSKAEWHRSSVPQNPDTLLLSKEGFYSRQIPLLGNDTLLNIGLLKKENKTLDYFNELIDPIAYDLISSLPSRSNHGQVAAVKIIYHQDNDLMYYMNTKVHTLHAKFAQDFLDFKKGNTIFNQTQYRENEDRYLYPANLNYYKDLDKYILHFVSANEMPCEKIRLLYDKIIATSYLEGKLFLLTNRLEFKDCDVPQITPEELYAGQNYQALNLEENYGYLNRIDLEDLENTYLGRHDIILLNGIPNDVAVVAGIITTEFQTPLSHINVLSHNRGTPNMALRDGWDNEILESLIGELVYLNVRADSFEIRKAELSEANAFWQNNEPQEIIELAKNTDFQGLVNLEEADYTYVNKIGGKAANFAEMLNVPQGAGTITTPESAFGIPFYYYDQHLKDAGLDVHIEHMLNDPDFIGSPVIRKAQLEDLQDRIKDHPLDTDFLDLVKNEIKDFADFPSYRFRSSTNAEDLEDFSGAGLYSSHSAKKDNSNKTIEKAIKKVWAGLWNWRAFEERSYYKIVHTSCAMGILVHRSFPDEDANGVVITRNLYNSNPGYIVNVQYKDHSIVFPEPGILSDQLILFTWSNIPGQNYMVEYLTYSNIPELNGATVMTDAELEQLANYCTALKNYFYHSVPHNCNCAIQDFALDIEFKIDSQVSERKLYIKQVRRYK